MLFEFVAEFKHLLATWSIAEPFSSVLVHFVIEPLMTGFEKVVRGCAVFKGTDVRPYVLVDVTSSEWENQSTSLHKQLTTAERKFPGNSL